MIAPVTESTNKKILLVEDHDGNIMFLRILIETAGYDCTIAETGKVALEHAEKEPFQLILLDLKLPDTDGFTICRQIDTFPMNANTPVVGISAEVTSSQRRKCLEAGMQDLREKKFELETLQALIEEYT